MMRAHALAVLVLVLTAIPGQAQDGSPGAAATRSTLYSVVGNELTQYAVDMEAMTLTRRGTVTLPVNVQYAWPHPSRKFLYVVWSNGGASYVGARTGNWPLGDVHGLSAFRVDSSGALEPHGRPIALKARPIQLSVDPPAKHVLVAYSVPSGVTVHEIEPDGTLGPEVPPSGQLDVGTYAHHVQADPSNRLVALVTRGNGPQPGRPEDPGGLKIFSYNDGVLANLQSIAPNKGFNFQPRDVAFHRSKPWLFLTWERQGQLEVYRINNGAVDEPSLFRKNTLADPSNVRPMQAASAVHLHPNGRFAYVGNRATAVRQIDGKAVLVGGENNIAVFEIDQSTGEPTLIQNADAHGIRPRSFSIHPNGQMLVAGNQNAFNVVDEKTKDVRRVPAGMSVFRIGGDGKLEFVRKYDVPTEEPDRSLFWVGFVPLP
jgi:6-phosphogluconolactonase